MWRHRFTFLALLIAATALVFAIWPVVADAPWEGEPALRWRSPTPQPSACDHLLDDFREAQTDIAARTIHERGRMGCGWAPLPRSSILPLPPELPPLPELPGAP